MTSHTVQTKLNGNELSIETGKVAKQADGAVIVRCGGTMVLSTVVAARSPMEGRDRDFLPLTVEYREKAYAGGKIPGGFFKREGRPDEKETLTCRNIDRPIRPLFPKSFRNEIQVINLVISADNENDPDVLAMIGTSAALCLSGIPFAGPIGAVRVTMVDGKLVVNPTYAQAAAGTLEVVMAATDEAVLMVEAGGKEIAEDQMLEAIAFGHEHCKQLVKIQKELIAQGAKPRWAFDTQAGADPALQAKVQQVATTRVAEALEILPTLADTFEIIVVNDASQDETSAVARSTSSFTTRWSNRPARDRQARKTPASCRFTRLRSDHLVPAAIPSRGGAMKYICLVYLVEKDMNAMTLSLVREWSRTGRKPARDIVLAFVSDEEAGGRQGAPAGPLSSEVRPSRSVWTPPMA